MNRSNKPARFLPLGLLLGGCHFLACILIVPITLRFGEAVSAGPTRTQLLGFSHVVTKILYFPVLSLALYPRHLFPGHWITIPIFINSLLWGGVLAGLVVGWRRLRAQR